MKLKNLIHQGLVGLMLLGAAQGCSGKPESSSNPKVLSEFDDQDNLTRETEKSSDPKVLSEFDEQDNLKREKIDFDGDGSFNQTVEYNPQGLITKLTEDQNGDGSIDGVTVYHYHTESVVPKNVCDADDNLIPFRHYSRIDYGVKRIFLDLNGDGHIDTLQTIERPSKRRGGRDIIRHNIPKVTYYQDYDAEGNLIREFIDRDSDGKIDEQSTSEFSPEGKLISFENVIFYSNGKIYDQRTSEFSHKGKLTRLEDVVFNPNGTPDRRILSRYDFWGILEQTTVTHSDYDEKGRLVLEVRDDHADGTSDLIKTHHYSSSESRSADRVAYFLSIGAEFSSEALSPWFLDLGGKWGI